MIPFAVWIAYCRDSDGFQRRGGKNPRVHLLNNIIHVQIGHIDASQSARINGSWGSTLVRQPLCALLRAQRHDLDAQSHNLSKALSGTFAMPLS